LLPRTIKDFGERQKPHTKCEIKFKKPKKKMYLQSTGAKTPQGQGVKLKQRAEEATKKK